MFGIGMQELLVIGIVALLVVGPKKLPELAKTLGRTLSEFRKTADDLTEDIKGAVKPEDDIYEPKVGDVNQPEAPRPDFCDPDYAPSPEEPDAVTCEPATEETTDNSADQVQSPEAASNPAEGPNAEAGEPKEEGSSDSDSAKSPDAETEIPYFETPEYKKTALF